MITFHAAGSLSVALDLSRPEVRQLILELAAWVALAPANTSVGDTAEDGSSAVRSVTAMATLVDSKGVEHTLNKIEARELCSKALVERFSAPAKLAA